MKSEKSEQLFARAQQLFPGGVNSPVRAFGSVGGTPRFIDRASGPHLWDVDGNRYIDYVLSWGPLAAGHAHPRVVEAITRAAQRGTSYGAPTAAENELAELIISLIPSIEMIRFVNSGTEATMSALRLARAYTGRQKIIKMAGCYHGHADLLLAQAGSGAATLGLPDSPGVPASAAASTLTAPFNDLAAVEALFDANPNQIAAVITEPIAGNMGFVMPREGYLAGLAALCRKHGALFVLDEVMTGFRAALGGAQAIFNLDPDLTCLGKVIGGGLPVGAFGGKRHIMRLIAPAGPVYQAGTLSGNPLAMAAGRATLQVLLEDGTFKAAAELTIRLARGLEEVAQRGGVAVQVGCAGTMLGMFFLSEAAAQISDFASARLLADGRRYARFFCEMLARGVYLPPSHFEAMFISTAHGPAEIEATLGAALQTIPVL